jgi:hypothetical protein
LAVLAGAPRVTLRGLTMHGAVHVGGGDLSIESCRFDGCEAPEGGALLLSDGMINAMNSTFSGNKASGSGGAVMASNGIAKFASCHFEDNQASARGGGLCIDGAELVLSDGTLLTGNNAPGSASVWLAQGSLVYMLPAPRGRWVESYGQPSIAMLASGGGLTADFPYACAPGLVGKDTAIATQSGPQCATLAQPAPGRPRCQFPAGSTAT